MSFSTISQAAQNLPIDMNLLYAPREVTYICQGQGPKEAKLSASGELNVKQQTGYIDGLVKMQVWSKAHLTAYVFFNCEYSFTSPS